MGKDYYASQLIEMMDKEDIPVLELQTENIINYIQKIKGIT